MLLDCTFTHDTNSVLQVHSQKNKHYCAFILVFLFNGTPIALTCVTNQFPLLFTTDNKQFIVLLILLQVTLGVFITEPIQTKPTNRSKKTEIQSNRKPNGLKIEKTEIIYWIGSDFGFDFQNRTNPIQTEHSQICILLVIHISFHLHLHSTYLLYIY